MNKKVSTTTDISAVSSNWRISTRNNSRNLYALALIDLQATEDDRATTYSQEFIFDINPRSMELTEPAAVVVVPTQDGGQFIEHQGQIYKNIQISGTMGLRPGKRVGDILPLLPIDNPFTGINGLPVGEKSGFERILELRNMFRTYFDLKNDPNLAHRVVMVWQNGKEGEHYIVEPIVFKTRRDASSPVTMNYDIAFRTIERADSFFVNKVEDSWKVLNAIDRVNERITKTSLVLGDALNTAEKLLDTTVGSTIATTEKILTPGRRIAVSFINFGRGVKLGIDQTASKSFGTNALDMFIHLQGTQTTYRTSGVSTPSSTAWAAYKKMLRVGAQIYNQTFLFTPSISERTSIRTTAYTNPVSGVPSTGGSPTNLQNTTVATGTAVHTVGNTDTIFSLAQRLLGDQARWKELVVLNDLKSPYIDPTGDGKDILRPNDQILVPAAPPAGGSAVVPSAQQNDDELVKRFGRDLKLDSYESVGGTNTLDLSVDNRGDITLIEGIDNLSQAIEVRFSTERGSLPTHPTYGLAVPIGSKATIRSLVRFQLDARASIISDSRISDVAGLSITVEGNVLNIKANLQVAAADGSLSINFNARR